ncbi:MAG: SDR family oxidoreductase, partial [Chloroflexota bacterium]
MTSDAMGVDLHQVLRRPPLPIDRGALARSLSGRRVFVTGAGGSIGACLAGMLRECGVAELVLLDNHEPSLYDLQGRLGATPNVVYHLADVRNAGKIGRLVATHRPDVLFHLAAYKHVPLGEENPDEAFAANVLGALNVVRAAITAGVATLVYPSTDKAVYPPSVYGATKRTVELLLRAFAAEMGR